MSAQLFSVTIRCEYCAEVISQTGTQQKDATLTLLRSKMHELGWKTARINEDGKLVIRDFCPSCRFEHGLG